MALIIDPDYLSQGNTTSVYSTKTTTRIKVISGGAFPTATMTVVGGNPKYSQYDYFEIRTANSLIANNNGLYQVTAAADPNYTVKKVAGSIGGLSNTNIPGDVSIELYGDNQVAGNNTPGTNLTVTARGKSVYYDTYSKKIWLIGDAASSNLSDDGVSLQALYSFTKEEWKNDPFLIKFDFPFTAITPEQFEIGSGTAAGWQLFANTVTTSAEFTGVSTNGRKTEELIRTGGWSEFDSDGTTLLRQYAGVITLGTFDAAADRAYYQQGNDPTDTGARENFVFTGPVNEGVLTYRYYPANNDYGVVTYPHSNTITRSTGSWITEGYQVGSQIEVVSSDVTNPIGTYVIASTTATDIAVTTNPFTANASNDKIFTSAWDNRNFLNLFLRANSTIAQSKSYDNATLADIGVTTLSNQVYRFPLTNSTDVKITGAGAPFETDGDITQAPYDGDQREVINIKYLPIPFNVRIDSGSTLRSFGIVVDSGTFSGSQGSFNGGTATFNTGVAPPSGTFNGGKLVIYDSLQGNSYASDTATEPSNDNKYTITGISGTTVTVDQNIGTSGSYSSVSFTLERSAANNAANSVPTSIEDIYAAIQYQLRLDVNINDYTGGNTVTGATADEFLNFVGDVLNLGQQIPTNPEGGGSGVFLAGYQAADVNDIRVYDNSAIERFYPLSVTVTLSFNDNLRLDPGGSKYWLFYDRTKRTNGGVTVASVSGRSAVFQSTALFSLDSGDDFNIGEYIRTSGFTNSENNGVFRIVDNASAPNDLSVVKVDGDPPIAEGPTTVNVDQQPIDTPSALLVKDTGDADVTGTISASSIQFSYAYTTNAQGARNAGDGDASVVARAIGFDTGQFVEVQETITSSATPISVVAGLERNYSND